MVSFRTVFDGFNDVTVIVSQLTVQNNNPQL